MKKLFSMRRLMVAQALVVSITAAAFGTDIRVATYNIDADVSTASHVPPSSIYTVMEAMGTESTYAPAQAVDIFALEETDGATTVNPMVTNLNSFYGAGTYATTSTQSPIISGTGNGPSSIIYNTTTLTLVQQGGQDFYTVPGTPGGSTSDGTRISRAVLRYEFQSKAGGAPFYVYVSHMKSSSDGDTLDPSDRATEAAAIRNDEANTLPAGASVLYVGDYNMGGSTEAGYQTMTAVTSPSASGSKSQGKAFDPLLIANPSETTWDTTNNDAAYLKMMTESIQRSSNFQYRDDLLMMTGNVYNGQVGGLSYIMGSEHAFGNPGTITSGGTFLSGNNTGTLAQALNASSDHLPVVADFTILTTPEPGTIAVLTITAAFMLKRRRA